LLINRRGFASSRHRLLASNFWPTSREMIKKVKNSFDENGISIPFPQVTYHGTPQMVALPERFVDARSKEA
jgi:small conductance mechanosensitive channel